MTSSNYEQKEFELGGTIYTFQRPPVRAALKMRMDWTNPDGAVDDIIMAEQVLKHIVVNPKLTLDDFDNVGQLQTVVNTAIVFAFFGTSADKELEELKKD